ncbi:Uncharacterised protein [Mycobacteroides abscessus subsp. abscessus]|nr:Uncharacterised protein [Mycobacteroides abscessus subsp. abscessus]
MAVICGKCKRQAYAFVNGVCEDCDNDDYNDVDEEYDRGA